MRGVRRSFDILRCEVLHAMSKAVKNPRTRRVPKERTLEQFIGMFLRRGKPHADGTPGAFCVRFYVVDRADLKPQRTEIGLRTNNRREAAERALVLISGLVSTARLWLPKRVLNLLVNTQLPLWVPLHELHQPKRGNHSSKGHGDFTPARKCGKTPARVVESGDKC